LNLRNKEKYNEYHKKYQLERYHRRRQRAFDLMGGKCNQCGGIDNLQFHHIDPNIKKYTLSKIGLWSEQKFEDEIKKMYNTLQRMPRKTSSYR